MGSGPFRFERRDGNKLVIEAVRQEGTNQPFLDRVVFLDLNRIEERQAMHEGKLDYVVASPSEGASLGTRTWKRNGRPIGCSYGW